MMPQTTTRNATERSGPESETGQSRTVRVEAVVETLAALQSHGNSVAEVAHDARNMVTALGLYCDLLEEPGVLAAPFAHYGSELRLVAAASRRLVERLVALDTHHGEGDAQRMLDHEADRWSAATRADAANSGAVAPFTEGFFRRSPASSSESYQHRDFLPAVPITNLAAEVLANRNLLAALAGPGTVLTVDTEGGAQPVRLTGEDLTRVLVNLVKNAAEAMSDGGRIHLSLCDRPAAGGATACVAMTIEDNGPGVAAEALEDIFAAGYTTRGRNGTANTGWPHSHRGLGLSITRSIIEAAGGRITAANRERGGARFTIELPVRKMLHGQ